MNINDLTIERDSVGGVENIGDFAPLVRNCAEHLLSFIGRDAQADERGAFEAHMRKRGEDYLYRRDAPGCDRIGEYCRQNVQDQWETWQARAAAPQAEAAQSEDRIDALQDMAFANGLQLGWNFGSNAAREDYEQALKARDGYVRVLRETRAAPFPDRENCFMTIEEIEALKEDNITLVNAFKKERARVVDLENKLLLATCEQPLGGPGTSPSRECGERQVASAVVREALESAFEERNGWRVKVAAAVRAIGAASAPTLGEDAPVAAWLHVFSIPGKRTEFASLAREVDIPEDFVRANQKGLVTHAVEPLYRRVEPTLSKPQWPYDEEFERDRQRLCAAQPQAAEPKGLTDEQRGALEILCEGKWLYPFEREAIQVLLSKGA